MKAKDRSIARRIQILVTGTVILAMTVFAAIIAEFQIHDALTERKKALESTGYVFASAVAESLANRDADGIRRVFRSVGRLQDITGVYAVDPANKVVASAGDLVMLSSDMIKGEASMIKMLTRGLMPVSVDVVRGGMPAGKLILVGDIRGIRTQLLHILIVLFLASASAMVASMILASGLQRRITIPIRKLTDAMLALTANQRYTQTQIEGAEGETLTLVNSFNKMVGEIHDRDKALQQLAYFDPLTGLHNQAHFIKELADETHIGSRNAVFLIEIERFKTIANVLGRVAGDSVLVEIAGRLTEAGGKLAYVARIRPTVFAVLFRHCDSLARAQECLAPFVASFYRPVIINGHRLDVAPRIGYAFASVYAEDGEELFRRASLALAESKRQAFAQPVPYAPAIGDKATENSGIESDLRQAIARGELEVHYQPIVNLALRRVEGFEALLRWRHKSGYIPPSKFIPIAEETGIIAQLGEWVLKKACQDAMVLSAGGRLARFMSVNVSPSQIMISGFVDKIHDALNASKLPPNLLCMEITESLFAGNSIHSIRDLMNELKAMGVAVALDDFGTGYSSLSYLEHLPFDKLKIDRAFVHGSRVEKAGASLLAGIIDLAHRLGMTVVAEGAEDVSEMKALAHLKCEFVQGYYFARPMPLTDALAAAEKIDGHRGDWWSRQSDESASPPENFRLGAVVSQHSS